ncbi:sensor domain-containing diguanylate cyclase [Mycoplasmatota bacterium WC30]
MDKKPRLLRMISKKIIDIPINDADYIYALKYGIFSAFLVFIEKSITFLFFSSAYINNKLLYLINVFLIALLLILMLLVKIKKLSKDTLYPRIILWVYPFLVIILASISVFLVANFPNFIFSYMTIMFIVSWTQIYSLKKRNILYGFALILAILLNIIANGLTLIAFEYFIISITTIVISYITASVHFKIYSKQRSAIDDLDAKNKTINKTIELVKKSHKDLITSKKITDTMLSITQEVLKNEKIEDILQLVLEEAVKLIPNAQAGSILMNNGVNMEYVAAIGYRLDKLKKIELRYEDLFQASLEDLYEPIIIKNLEVFDEVHLEGKTKKLLEEAVQLAKSCLTCSFKYNGEFFGSINIDNFESQNIFINDDKYLIKQLAKEIEIIVSIHKLYEQALRPTKYDDLTNAYTRKYCMKLVTKLIDKHKEDKIAICTIDINSLKSINDRFGHDVGDSYLVFFADAIRKSIGENNIFGRVGGDEFLLIFHNLNDQRVLEKIELVRKYLKANKFVTKEFEGEITFASGISIYPKDSKNILDLIKLSDKRMYKNKSVQKTN